MKIKKISFTTRLLVVFSVLLLAANCILGLVLMGESKDAMRILIRQRMLDVANTAAATLDGDALETFTADDADTEPYREALDSLAVFQENIDLAYIYCVREVSEGSFVFTVDPTVIDPAEFGEPVQYTEALHNASRGIPDADETPYQDRWGRFYSAYSPVFDSAGRIAGIVGVDFNAEWFDDQIALHTRTVLFFSLLSLTLSVWAILLISSRIRGHFRDLDNDLDELVDSMDHLAQELETYSGGEFKVHRLADTHAAGAGDGDEIDALGSRIDYMREELKRYILYVHAQAYTDAMTGVGNKTAYLDLMHRLQQDVEAGVADFAVAVFDLNGLKTVNDQLGHEAGDRLIVSAATALRTVFGTEHVYRIGGDEFIAVLEKARQEEIDEYLAALDRQIAAMNQGKAANDVALSISGGGAVYTPGQDADYNAVFRRADEAMYRKKAAYYQQFGDRRRR